MSSYLTHLECSECGHVFSYHEKHTTCRRCNSLIFARYGLCQAIQSITKEAIQSRPRGIWRWEELLPIQTEQNRVALGEGDTPLIKLNKTGRTYGITHLYCKDESRNPTSSFTARGICVALSRARELGIEKIAIPTAGNAGGAAAAYAARLGLQLHVYMPKQSLQSNRTEVVDFGAHLHLIDGSLQDAYDLVASDCMLNRWFNLADFHEPYRLEGEKTIGYEIAEQLHWSLPDWIIYPTGGGTGLVGMWKGFLELQEMGWLVSDLPQIAVIQSDQCAPIVKAYKAGENTPHVWEGSWSHAAGLNIPNVFAGKRILKIINDSHGIAHAVNDLELEIVRDRVSATEGLLISLEGAAAFLGLSDLFAMGIIKPDQNVLVVNTSSGIKSL